MIRSIWIQGRDWWVEYDSPENKRPRKAWECAWRSRSRRMYYETTDDERAVCVHILCGVLRDYCTCVDVW